MSSGRFPRLCRPNMYVFDALKLSKNQSEQKTKHTFSYKANHPFSSGVLERYAKKNSSVSVKKIKVNKKPSTRRRRSFFDLPCTLNSDLVKPLPFRFRPSSSILLILLLFLIQFRSALTFFVSIRSLVDARCTVATCGEGEDLDK